MLQNKYLFTSMHIDLNAVLRCCLSLVFFDTFNTNNRMCASLHTTVRDE